MTASIPAIRSKNSEFVPHSGQTRQKQGNDMEDRNKRIQWLKEHMRKKLKELWMQKELKKKLYAELFTPRRKN
jgi:hypothetical protein